MKTTLLMALSSLFIAVNAFSSDLSVTAKRNDTPSAKSKIINVELAYTGHDEDLAGGPRRLSLTSESNDRCLITGGMAAKYGFSVIELASLISEDKVDVDCLSDGSPYASRLNLKFKLKN